MTDYRAIAASIADELERNPDNWSQFYIASNSNRRPVEPSSPEACSWCLVGLILRKDGDPREFRQISGLQSLAWWNDDPTRTVADVIALCRKVAQS